MPVAPSVSFLAMGCVTVDRASFAVGSKPLCGIFHAKE